MDVIVELDWEDTGTTSFQIKNIKIGLPGRKFCIKKLETNVQTNWEYLSFFEVG